MALGIRPTVDFAFKKIFGSPENSVALISLLNAVLQPMRTVTAVEILNPFSMQEFKDAKQIHLDIKCRDASGVWFNVEMQVFPHMGLTQRIVYYAASMYVDQLTEGAGYNSLNSAINITFLMHNLFTDTPQSHHHFVLTDQNSGKFLDRAIEVHTVEMMKFTLDPRAIKQASELEKWIFFLMRASEYNKEELQQLLPDLDFQPAIQTLERIDQKSEDKDMYNRRQQAERDFQSVLTKAREEGIAIGEQRGITIGRDEGIGIGIEKGELIGSIKVLQQILGDAVASDEQLLGQSLDELKNLLASLQERLRNRN